MPKQKCVLILTEGKSDRAALSDFFLDLYSKINDDIDVFFPLLSEERITRNDEIEIQYDGDITSRRGIMPKNILPLINKLFIHPEFQKHPAYKYPASICEIIHLVDIDGVFLNDDKIFTANDGRVIEHPMYDISSNMVQTKDKDALIDRNQRKRANLQKLVNTRKLRITLAKGDDEPQKERPYRVFYFSTNLDHVLFDKPNNNNKVNDASKFADQYENDALSMAKYFLTHDSSVNTTDYIKSWEMLFNDNETLTPRTNINVLIIDLMKRAGIDYKTLL